MKIEKILKENDIEYKSNSPLSAYTTMGVGGPASYLAEIKDSEKLEHILTDAFKNQIPCLVLGKGSNVIISDEGFKGLVLINKTDNLEIIDEEANCIQKHTTESRLETFNIKKENRKIKNFALIRTASGVSVSSLAQKLYKKGISGLEWFAGIPASVGGAVYMNMHGGHYYFADLVQRAKLFSENGSRIVKNSYFKFDYDYSILHTTKEIVLWVELCLPKGNIENAKRTAKEWAGKKSNQPQKSAGCVFRNLTNEEKEKSGLPSVSIGYLLDNVLGLKGYQIGGAKISEKHAAFIENTGSATAKDVYQLVNFIKKTVNEKIKIDLKTEIEFIGTF
jgi:UDP-N-acetylmuramate dehydrogenase